jgi:hypothetical protein
MLKLADNAGRSDAGTLWGVRFLRIPCRLRGVVSGDVLCTVRCNYVLEHQATQFWKHSKIACHILILPFIDLRAVAHLRWTLQGLSLRATRWYCVGCIASPVLLATRTSCAGTVQPKSSRRSGDGWTTLLTFSTDCALGHRLSQHEASFPKVPWFTGRRVELSPRTTLKSNLGPFYHDTPGLEANVWKVDVFGNHDVFDHPS